MTDEDETLSLPSWEHWDVDGTAISSLQQARNSVNWGPIYQARTDLYSARAMFRKYGSCPAPGPRVYDFMIFQFYGGHLTDECLLVNDHSGIYFAFKRLLLEWTGRGADTL